MTKVCFVSGGDSKYFPMLLEWVHSIRFFPQSAAMDIAIIDAGLTPEQIKILENGMANKVVSPDWPGDLAHKRNLDGQDSLKACVSRPFIPQLFPGYDIYIWMDADTWVQSWFAVEWLIQGAEKNAIAICAQIDRAYSKKDMRLDWLGPFPWRPRSFYYSNGRKAFSGKLARQLFPFKTVNAGVFALKGTAPHWIRWQELIIKALRKGKIFTAEQLTLGIMIHLEKCKAEFLPAVCNWLCSTKPVWDSTQKIFVEPYIPHHPVGILHLSGIDAMRLDRTITSEFSTINGDKETVSLSYRYPRFDGKMKQDIS